MAGQSSITGQLTARERYSAHQLHRRVRWMSAVGGFVGAALFVTVCLTLLSSLRPGTPRSERPPLSVEEIEQRMVEMQTFGGQFTRRGSGGSPIVRMLAVAVYGVAVAVGVLAHLMIRAYWRYDRNIASAAYLRIDARLRTQPEPVAVMPVIDVPVETTLPTIQPIDDSDLERFRAA